MVFQPSRGLAGGILCSWFEGAWTISLNFSGVGYVGISVTYNNTEVYVINVYALCSTSAKRRVWEDLLKLKQNIGRGEWCLVGDFNAVTCVAERKGGVVSVQLLKFLTSTTL